MAQSAQDGCFSVRPVLHLVLHSGDVLRLEVFLVPDLSLFSSYVLSLEVFSIPLLRIFYSLLLLPGSVMKHSLLVRSLHLVALRLRKVKLSVELS